MLDLIRTPFQNAFKKFAEDISTDCFICSPYITTEPVKMLVETISRKKPKSNININILTDISYRTLLQGATEIPALLYLLNHHHNAHIIYLPKIHAKVYIANQSSAIVTSANFTLGGGKINLEYGVKVSERAIVQKIQSDMNEYGKLGEYVTRNELENIHSEVEEIKRTIESEQKNIAKAIKLHSIEKQRKIEDNLIRVRVKNKSVNAIFSETLLYLLSKHPATTKELHQQISSIHPDLCDDSTNRVIDGKGYGMLWKHQVRNAQEYLRRTASIRYEKETRLWRTIKK